MLRVIHYDSEKLTNYQLLKLIIRRVQTHVSRWISFSWSIAVPCECASSSCMQAAPWTTGLTQQVENPPLICNHYTPRFALPIPLNNSILEDYFRTNASGEGKVCVVFQLFFGGFWGKPGRQLRRDWNSPVVLFLLRLLIRFLVFGDLCLKLFLEGWFRMYHIFYWGLRIYELNNLMQFSKPKVYQISSEYH